MNRTRIVPAIDLIDGRCVRLERGAFETSSVVGADPVETARHFEEQGFTRLHLVDLSGAREGAPRHLPVLEAIASSTSLVIDYSGGLRTEESIEQALAAGAAKVVIGSAAVTRSADVLSWFESFGGEAIILGLDVLDGFVRVHGWTEGTGHSIDDVVRIYSKSGLRTLMSTDIGKDGMLSGPSTELYRDLRTRYPELELIASGGVTSVDDVRTLAQIGVEEIIIGKGLYAGTVDLAAVKEFVW